MGETDKYVDGSSMGWYRGLYRLVWLQSDGSLDSLGHARQSFPKEVTLILAWFGGGGELARFKNKKYIIRRKDKSSNSVIPLCCCLVAKPRAKSIVTPRTAAHQASLSYTVSWSLLRFMSTESVVLLNLSHPLLLLPSVFPSITVFSNDSVLSIRWPKYWSYILYIWGSIQS